MPSSKHPAPPVFADLAEAWEATGYDPIEQLSVCFSLPPASFCPRSIAQAQRLSWSDPALSNPDLGSPLDLSLEPSEETTPHETPKLPASPPSRILNPLPLATTEHPLWSSPLPLVETFQDPTLPSLAEKLAEQDGWDKLSLVEPAEEFPPLHETSSHETSSHETSSHETSSHETSSHDTSSHDTSSHGASSRDTSPLYKSPPLRESPPPRERNISSRPSPERKKVRVRVFHPDVDAGGGYIEQEVFADRIPPGAVLVGEAPARKATEHRASRPPKEALVGRPLPGGILEAGMRLRAEGRLQRRTSPSPLPTALPPLPELPELPSFEKSPSPVTSGLSSSPVTSDLSSVPVASDLSARPLLLDLSPTHDGSPPTFQTLASPALPAASRLASTFLQGLPNSSKAAGPAQRQALDAAFSGLAKKTPALPSTSFLLPPSNLSPHASRLSTGSVAVLPPSVPQEIPGLPVPPTLASLQKPLIEIQPRPSETGLPKPPVESKPRLLEADSQKTSAESKPLPPPSEAKPLPPPSEAKPFLPTLGPRPAEARPLSLEAKPPLASKVPDRIVIDGRRIDAPGAAAQEAPPKIAAYQALPSPSEDLRIFELSIKTQRGSAFDAHLFLWEEGHFDLTSRVNDADPRPRLWSEEGIRGLGFEERQKELQRWGLRDWWDGFKQKGLHPVLATAASRIGQDSEQVALVYEPDYQIYRLYQRGGSPLTGSYPLVFFAKGKLHHARLSLDSVEEKERITPARLQTLLGEACPAELPSLLFTATPLLKEGEGIDFRSSPALDLLRDQIGLFFRFPVLELPHPLGGSGTIQVDLGLFEMSQAEASSQALRVQAASSQAVLLKASAGYLSDLVRRDLWRMKERPAQTWTGYTPKQVAEAIRVALREDHYNMQGFMPKKPGDYRYDLETGEFRIVLRRKLSSHTFLLQGEASGRRILGLLVPYTREGREGMEIFGEYASLLQDPHFPQFWPSLVWQDAWLTAPCAESRASWLSPSGLPYTPLLRQMPDWGRGFAHALFLLRPALTSTAASPL